MDKYNWMNPHKAQQREHNRPNRGWKLFTDTEYVSEVVPTESRKSRMMRLYRDAMNFAGELFLYEQNPMRETTLKCQLCSKPMIFGEAVMWNAHPVCLHNHMNQTEQVIQIGRKVGA